MMLALLRRFLSVLMAAILFVPSLFAGRPLAGDMKTAYPDEEPALVFSVISDVHLTDSDARANMLALGLADMQAAERRLDAAVLLGDNTDGGAREQYELLYRTMADYDIARETLLVEGNHDTWTADDYAPAKALFLEYSETITGRTLTEAYFSTEINGYKLIALASEADHTDAYFSDAQLSWLKAELDAATAAGKPVFVFSHWPLNYTHGLPRTWEGNPAEKENVGGMGDQSDAVEAILKGYENVFLFSGHLHAGFANGVMQKLDPVYKHNSYESDGSFHSVNLPSYMYPSPLGQGLFNGKGAVVEVYADRVLVRARCFSGGYFMESYSETFALN